ncbi:MAG: NAD(P)-dependent alcohol dehydrogenase [Cyclobacteriaceae bacterium]
MTFEEAATVPTGATNALHYMRKSEIKAGDKVLINGASGCFGIYAVQLAKLWGAEVTGVDRGDKLEVIRELGADHLIDYSKEDFTKNGVQYDAIFDVRGDRVWQMMKSLKKGGRYVLGTPWVGASIKGCFAALTGGKKFIIELAKEGVDDLEYVDKLIEEGKLKTVIGKTFTLDEIAEAHRHVESGDKVGHVAIKVAS